MICSVAKSRQFIIGLRTISKCFNFLLADAKLIISEPGNRPDKWRWISFCIRMVRFCFFIWPSCWRINCLAWKHLLINLFSWATCLLLHFALRPRKTSPQTSKNWCQHPEQCFQGFKNHVYNATTCTGNIMAGNFECLCIHSELFRFVQLAELDFCMLGTSVSPTKAISLHVSLQRNSRVNQRWNKSSGSPQVQVQLWKRFNSEIRCNSIHRIQTGIPTLLCRCKLLPITKMWRNYLNCLIEFTRMNIV